MGEAFGLLLAGLLPASLFIYLIGLLIVGGVFVKNMKVASVTVLVGFIAAWVIAAIVSIIISKEHTAGSAMEEMIPAVIIGSIISLIGVIFAFKNKPKALAKEHNKQFQEETSSKPNIKNKAINSIIKIDTTLENKFYEQAWSEIESDNLKKSLWAKSFSECNGDSDKTKAKYIKLRVQELTNETNTVLKHEATNKDEPPKTIEETNRMEDYGITFDGENYYYETYKYHNLEDAMNYAKLQLKN